MALPDQGGEQQGSDKFKMDLNGQQLRDVLKTVTPTDVRKFQDLLGKMKAGEIMSEINKVDEETVEKFQMILNAMKAAQTSS